MRLIRLFLLALAALGLLLATQGEAQAAQPRIRHQTGCCWVWFGPANYQAGGGSYGINIAGPGNAILDLGFSSTLCSSGATWQQSVNNYFAAKRQGVRNSGLQILTASAIFHPAQTGTMYRRQNLTFRRVVNGQVRTRGVLQFDYDFSQNVDGINYCYARNLGMYSNAGVWNQRRTTLANINSSLAYSGPGACDPSPTTNC
jgi:hypothetical protein